MALDLQTLDTHKGPVMQTIFTTLEVSDLLKCDQERVEDLLRRGELPGIKFGRSWIVPSEALNHRLTEMALSTAESRRARVQAPPATVSMGASQCRGRRRTEPPKLPNIEDIEKLLRQR